MRYLVVLKAQPSTTPPPPELFEAIVKLGAEATQAGVLLDTAGLAPLATGARVTLSGGKVSVTDGPFAEAKELISYAMYDVRSKEEIVEWTTRFLKLHRDNWPGWEGEADIQQVFGGPQDFDPSA
jgi:hypothetical protein